MVLSIYILYVQGLHIGGADARRKGQRVAAAARHAAEELRV